MSFDRVFQYQQLAEPLFTGGEVIYADKWLPSYPSILDRKRPIPSHPELFEPFPAALAQAAVTVDEWFQQPPAPQRAAPRPPVGQTVGPLVPITAGETVTVDKWVAEPPTVQARRQRVPEPGGFRVEPSLFVTPPLDWNRAPDPIARPRRPFQTGDTFAPVFVPPPPPPPPVPNFFGTLPVLPPTRPPVALGTFYAEPIGPQGEPPPPVPPPIPGAGFQNKPLVERAADPPNEAQRVRRHTEKVAEIVNSLGGQDLLFYRGRNSWGIRPTGFEDVRAPSANDDVRIGAFRGATWIDTSTDTAYICVNPAEGAAVWKPLT